MNVEHFQTAGTAAAAAAVVVVPKEKAVLGMLKGIRPLQWPFVEPMTVDFPPAVKPGHLIANNFSKYVDSILKCAKER